MGAIDTLMQDTGIGRIEAEELIRIADKISSTFFSLSHSYSYQNVEDTRKHIEAKRAHDGKDRLGRMLGGKPSVPYSAKRMWNDYAKASEQLSLFNSANSAHRTGLNNDAMLTKCFEAMHQNQRLRHATEVPEGRRGYETLSSSTNIARQAGFLS